MAFNRRLSDRLTGPISQFIICKMNYTNTIDSKKATINYQIKQQHTYTYILTVLTIDKTPLPEEETCDMSRIFY